MFLKSFQFKLFGSFILFGFILSLITLYIFTKVIEDEYLSHKTDLFYELILKKDEKIFSFQNEIKIKIDAVANSFHVTNFTQEDQKEHLSPIFEPLLKMQSSIQKISIVDKNFNEKYNTSKYIDNNDENNIKVFTKLNSLKIGESFVSEFFYDANLKIPYYKVIFRIKDGFLIADINLKNTIFNTIEKSTYKENWFLVDHNGRFIIHKDDKYNWSSYRNVKHNLKDEFPLDYKNILEDEVYFNDQIMSKRIVFDNGEYATLLLEYKEDFAQELKDKYKDIFIFVVLVIVLVSIILAFILSKPFIRINKKMKKLNDTLDKQVKERTKELSTSKQKLEKLNEELEQRVEYELSKNIAQHNKHIEDKVKNAQLSSIGQLAAGITHEINTPLTYIKGNIEMMRYDIEDISDERLRKSFTNDFAKVDEGINRIANIIDTMREVSQSNQEDKEEVNIYETLIIAVNMINNRAKQISKIYINDELFHIDIKKDKFIFSCKIQKQRVEQLWIVILNNALDILEKIKDYNDRKISIEVKNVLDKIVVKIKDNGGGIPEDIIDHIFDPVFTTKKHAGLGVGLNVAKKIVDDQSAKLQAYNEDNCAVFEVSFNVA